MAEFTLPDGWEGSFNYDDRYLMITAPGAGCVTVDFEHRGFRGGWVTTGRPIDSKRHTGRGWRQALVADAVTWLKKVYEERR